MKALVIEPHTPDTYTFIDGLHETTHCRVQHVQTLDEGFHAMNRTYFDLVLVMVEHSSAASKIVEEIHSFAVERHIRRPYVILMFNETLPLPETRRCRDMDAMCMLRGYPPAVYQEAKLAFWTLAIVKYDATVRVRYQDGHHLLYAGSSPTHVSLGAQLTKLAVLVLGGLECYSVNFVADQLGICTQSVKKYFLELRRVFGGIFWIERRVGGTVCGARANVVWL